MEDCWHARGSGGSADDRSMTSANMHDNVAC
jgi:hypothetical protein